MKRRNASKGPQLNRKPDNTANKPAVQAIDKKWLIIGAAALVVVVILTAGLVRFYGDSVVARVNGMPIRESVVRLSFDNDPDLRLMAEFGMLENASEMAAREAALHRIFEDYARRNNVRLTGNETQWGVINAVIDAVIADPGQFANFEAYMPEDIMPAPDAESLAEEILARIIAGEDFDELLATYSDDHGMPTGGYAFIEGAMVTEFFEATRNLEIGEISGLVPTDFGFHIIKRIEPPAEENGIMIPGSMHPVPPPLDTDDEIFGATHILVAIQEQPIEDRQRIAVYHGFEAKRDAADIVFLSGLYNVFQP